VARRIGIRTSAIRYYEKVGVLPKPVRASGQRRYTEGTRQRLAIVRFSQHVGFSIAEIRSLLEGAHDRPPRARWRAMAAVKPDQLKQLMSRAETMHRLVRKTLREHCPHLVEHGSALEAKTKSAARHARAPVRELPYVRCKSLQRRLCDSRRAR
jgi:MerR family redox-sensitive transcriptional activator SoxR